MKNRIAHEIDKTLDCMDETLDIQVNPMFAENLQSRIAGIRVSRGLAYRNRAFYPVAILLLVVMNLAVLSGSFGKQTTGSSQYDQAGIMATEYGMGQSGYTTF